MIIECHYLFISKRSRFCSAYLHGNNRRRELQTPPYKLVSYYRSMNTGSPTRAGHGILLFLFNDCISFGVLSHGIYCDIHLWKARFVLFFGGRE